MKILSAECLLEELNLLRSKYEDVQLKLEQTANENDDIKKELGASKADNDILLKAKLDIEDDLKATKQNLATVTQEKEFCFQDLTESKEKVTYLLKRNDDLTKKRDEYIIKYKESLEESVTKNSQLNEQLLAVTEELEIEKNKSALLESEVLTMEKKISELQSTIQSYTGLNIEVEMKVNVLPEDTVAHVSSFLKEKKGVDVTFVLDGDKEVFAHQLILAIRSPFFADKFYGKVRNQENRTIPLKGVDPEAFEKMIRYCYDWEPRLETTEDACALFKVAFEFGVRSLVNVCAAFLKQTEIEPRNVFKILEVSEQMDDGSLTDKCLKTLEKETEKVMASCDLDLVTPSMMHILLKLPILSLSSEYELIAWILEWAKIKCENLDLNYKKSVRDYLGNLMRHINFLSLTGEQFAKLCKNHPDFFTSEEIASLSLNMTFPGTRELPDWYNKNQTRRVYTGTKE